MASSLTLAVVSVLLLQISCTLSESTDVDFAKSKNEKCRTANPWSLVDLDVSSVSPKGNDLKGLQASAFSCTSISINTPPCVLNVSVYVETDSEKSRIEIDVVENESSILNYVYNRNSENFIPGWQTLSLPIDRKVNGHIILRGISQEEDIVFVDCINLSYTNSIDIFSVKTNEINPTQVRIIDLSHHRTDPSYDKILSKRQVDNNSSEKRATRESEFKQTIINDNDYNNEGSNHETDSNSIIKSKETNNVANFRQENHDGTHSPDIGRKNDGDITTGNIKEAKYNDNGNKHNSNQGETIANEGEYDDNRENHHIRINADYDEGGDNGNSGEDNGDGEGNSTGDGNNSNGGENNDNGGENNGNGGEDNNNTGDNIGIEGEDNGNGEDDNVIGGDNNSNGGEEDVNGENDNNNGGESIGNGEENDGNGEENNSNEGTDTDNGEEDNGNGEEDNGGAGEDGEGENIGNGGEDNGTGGGGDGDEDGNNNGEEDNVDGGDNGTGDENNSNEGDDGNGSTGDGDGGDSNGNGGEENGNGEDSGNGEGDNGDGGDDNGSGEDGGSTGPVTEESSSFWNWWTIAIIGVIGATVAGMVIVSAYYLGKMKGSNNIVAPIDLDDIEAPRIIPRVQNVKPPYERFGSDYANSTHSRD